jgi:hypothetical protein
VFKPQYHKKKRDPHLQNNQIKMDWRCGLSGKASALPVWSPEFKPDPTMGFPYAFSLVHQGTFWNSTCASSFQFYLAFLLL